MTGISCIAVVAGLGINCCAYAQGKIRKKAAFLSLLLLAYDYRFIQMIIPSQSSTNGSHKDFQYTDFDAFSKDIEEASVHCLQLVEDDYLRGKCSCLALAKQHLFKHILAVSAQLNLADCVIPLVAKQRIGQRRGPGCPKNAKRALIKHKMGSKTLCNIYEPNAFLNL
ncbi:hypothetical protein BpHYR1_007371 [Brachionus plicatilis]|uniref:Uncharacterized protein n=1 Tax=Brachionus plicatilis TaxID=10195 RepID=A0A3M7PTQ5_BRAPC|nr:hypothetical protein BpHYR1_007371 [Brachionus plicatilis]